MIFSQNQNRHVFVVKSNAKSALSGVTTVGDIFVGGPTSGPNANTEAYFNYQTPGGLIRTDIIKKDNILWARATDAADMAMPLKEAIVTLDSNVNSGAPIPGEDYVLNIKITQFVGGSDEDTYHKQGVVHAYTGMTASAFYLKLAKSLALNFSRDINKFFKFYVTSGDPTATPSTYAETEITKSSNINDTSIFSATYTGVLIKEVEQPWALGTIPQKSVHFTVNPSVVMDGANDLVIWGSTEYKDSSDVVVNSHIIADLEWDSMVERGDVYKNVGWPYVINTTYLVDSSNAYGYDTLDIHFYFVDSKEGAQKSEKTITFVCPKSGASDHAIINALIGKLNTQLDGTIVSTLS